MAGVERGRSARRGSKPGLCGTFGRGHDVPYLAAVKAHSKTPVQGRLAAVENTLIVLDFGKDGFRTFRNHHPQRLLSIIKIGGSAWAPDGYWSILRSGGGDCFSILPADEEWRACDQERPRSVRFRPPKRPSDKSLSGTADLSPVSKPIYAAICRWFPRSNDSVREQLAFAVAYDVLHASEVEERLWMGAIPAGTAEPSSSSLVADRIYATVRDWFRHHPAAVCRALAEEITFEVLSIDHVLGELWAFRFLDDDVAKRGESND